MDLCAITKDAFRSVPEEEVQRRHKKMGLPPSYHEK
jgi:hypothetical protein